MSSPVRCAKLLWRQRRRPGKQKKCKRVKAFSRHEAIILAADNVVWFSRHEAIILATDNVVWWWSSLWVYEGRFHPRSDGFTRRIVNTPPRGVKMVCFGM